LHLLQKLINVHQIILGSQVRQWESVLVLWDWTTMTANMDHLGTRWNVLRKASALNWKALKSHQALANLGVGGGIDLSAFGISKELV
jgi:hypothetical protein